jgi:hypothetical protein
MAYNGDDDSFSRDSRNEVDDHGLTNLETLDAAQFGDETVCGIGEEEYEAQEARRRIYNRRRRAAIKRRRKERLAA